MSTFVIHVCHTLNPSLLKLLCDDRLVVIDTDCAGWSWLRLTYNVLFCLFSPTVLSNWTFGKWLTIFPVLVFFAHLITSSARLTTHWIPIDGSELFEWCSLLACGLKENWSLYGDSIDFIQQLLVLWLLLLTGLASRPLHVSSDKLVIEDKHLWFAVKRRIFSDNATALTTRTAGMFVQLYNTTSIAQRVPQQAMLGTDFAR